MTTFISKFANYRIVLKSQRYKEVSGAKFLTPGLTVEFSNGSFETNDPDVIKQLKETKGFGIDYWTTGKDKDEPSREAVREKNEAKTYINDNTKVHECEYCKKQHSSVQSLMAHARTCSKRPE